MYLSVDASCSRHFYIPWTSNILVLLQSQTVGKNGDCWDLGFNNHNDSTTSGDLLPHPYNLENPRPVFRGEPLVKGGAGGAARWESQRWSFPA